MQPNSSSPPIPRDCLHIPTLVASLTLLPPVGGNFAVAATIVGSDFLSKSGTMYIGERLFNKVQAGRGGGGENVMRSVVKAIIWRLFAAFNTMVCPRVCPLCRQPSTLCGRLTSRSHGCTAVSLLAV